MYFILGAGGFAREVGLVAESNNLTIDGYLSDDPLQHGMNLTFAKCLGTIEAIALTFPGQHYFTPGIGSPSLRRKLVERALQQSWLPKTITDRHAMLPSHFGRAHFTPGYGSVYCRGTSGTVDITIGNYVNVNLNCTLGHDCILEDYVNLSPDINVSGYVHIEEDVDIGTGVVILPHVRIGKGSIVGAGATVTKDIPANQIWVGTPAKFLRNID